MVLARLSALDRRLPVDAPTVVGVVALCVLLSAAGTAVVRRDPGSPVVAAAQAPSPTASKTPAAKPTASVPPGKPDEPADYLLDVATIPGYHRVSDRLAGAGPMDLEDAAVIEASGDKPTEEDRDALRKLGYVRGHSRVWRKGDDMTFVVVVYEWKTTKGPQLFVKGVEQVTREKDANWKPRIAQATGVCLAEEGEADDTIVAAVGKHSFLMILTREGGCGAAEHAPVTGLADRIVKHAASLGA
jgi:hypothetical protein